jgi:hypothetical protein
VFAAQDGQGGARSLWSTDGTVSGTSSITKQAENPTGLVVGGQRVFLDAGNGLHVASWTSSTPAAAPVVGKVSENLGVELRVDVLADEGDDAIDAADGTAVSRSVTLPAAARIAKASDTAFTDAGINAMLRDAVRDALTAGHTKLRLRLSLPTRSDGLSQSPVRLDIATSLPEAATKFGVPTGDAGQTRLTVAPKASLQTGFLFDLFDAKGSLLAQARTSADIRRLDAG